MISKKQLVLYGMQALISGKRRITINGLRIKFKTLSVVSNILSQEGNEKSLKLRSKVKQVSVSERERKSTLMTL